MMRGEAIHGTRGRDGWELRHIPTNARAETDAPDIEADEATGG